MAPGESAGGEPAALEGAVPRDRFERILGARRMKPATRRERGRDEALVPADQRGEEPARELAEGTHRSPGPQHRAAPGEEIGAEAVERGAVGFAARLDDEVPGGLLRLELEPPDLAQAAAQTVAGHGGRLKFRNDQSH